MIRTMTGRAIRYSVGNENNPANPWGRSELVIQADGSVRLDHHFSRRPGVGAWTGCVDAEALDALWAALDRAGFPAAPGLRPVPDETLRRLTVEEDGAARAAVVGWSQAPSLPGYAEAFDLLDGVIRQLSGAAVSYPTRQQLIVRDVTALSD
jgi:hypothetical protein